MRGAGGLESGSVQAAPDDESIPGPPKISASKIHDDPLVMFFQDFVTQEEVAHILRLCENRWERSQVTAGKASTLLGASAGQQSANTLGQEGVGETRTSDSVYLDFDESIVVERIAARVAHVAGTTLEYVEPLVALRYHEGQYFKLHHDGAMRSATVFLYLNGLEEGGGGQTSFPHLGFQVPPAARAAVMWKNRLPSGEADMRLKHEAKPVEKGVKYAMNCFVNAQPQRDASHVVLRHLSGPPGREAREGDGDGRQDEGSSGRGAAT